MPNASTGTETGKGTSGTDASGEYLADIAVTIRDAAGGPVFEATCPSPWLLIRLAPGRYEVTARSPDNQTQSTAITVLAERQQERILRFN